MLRETLQRAYGELGQVRKRRLLFMAGRTRIHLDQVEGLGSYLELEVVLKDDESVQAGQHEAGILLEKLGVMRADLVDRAYIDLCQAKTEKSAGTPA